MNELTAALVTGASAGHRAGDCRWRWPGWLAVAINYPCRRRWPPMKPSTAGAEAGANGLLVQADVASAPSARKRPGRARRSSALAGSTCW